MTIKIGNFPIGSKFPPFIIAEAGINHNGNLDFVKKMIHVAKEAGASAIKFQTFKAEEFIADVSQTYTYKSQGKEITESMIDMFKRCEFSRDKWFKIKQYCDDEEIIFLSSPLNQSDLDLLLELNIPAIKLGSTDFTNIPFLKYCAATKLPIILSCGMSYISEIKEALTTIDAFNGYPTILLLTTSEYPTPTKDVNLLKFQTIKKEFPSVVLGFSDHTQGPLASSISVGFGASVFEKHFTLDHELPGPDHWFSENPTGLKNWVNSILTSYDMMGSSEIKPTDIELENKKNYQKTVVSLMSIKKDEIFDRNNIGLKRVFGGNGLHPRNFEQLLGKHSNRDYEVGEKIID